MRRNTGISGFSDVYPPHRCLPYMQERFFAYLLLAFLCAPACATVNVKDYGALGDGIANDTAPLNTAFRDACATSEDVYLPAGTYTVSPFDTLPDCGISVHGDGAQSTILKLTAPARQSMWNFHGSPARTSALVIHDLSLDGGHLGGSGLVIEEYEAVILNRVSIHDFGTPGYSFGHNKPFDGLYIRNVENVLITDSQFTGNERYGIELQAVHSSTVQHSAMSSNGGLGGVSEQNFEGPLDGPLFAEWVDNTLIANGSGGIDVETDPKLSPAQGVLRANRVIDCGNDKWDSGWGLVLGLHSFGIIEGNWVQNFAAHAPPSDYTNAIVYTHNAGPISIRNNTIVATKSRGILGLNGVYPVGITGNTLVGNGTGILIYNSPSVRITNNMIANSSGFGIVVFWSHHSTISGNRLAGNFRNFQIDGHTLKPAAGDSGFRSSLLGSYVAPDVTR